eukprot:TRINITY_DN1286_c0_g1_i1.p1 TRINITY_DN1286_c0_g1~~TRINITY_DN1286_c0_g1_i1.p1  ORF type:complete len:500 (-),score=28.87 TRINITY_DN1286_c0_g1_i1:15-1514(-)
MYRTCLLAYFFICFISVHGLSTISGLQMSPGSVYYQRFGSFTQDDSPFGGDSPYLSFNFTTAVSLDSNYSYPTYPAFEVLLFFSGIRSHVGQGTGSILERKAYCCTPEDFHDLKCSRIGLIFDVSQDPSKNGEQLYYQKIAASEINSQTLNSKINLGSTGIWYLFMANCDDESVGNGITYELSGAIEWKNPYGYVPGQSIGYIPLYWLMALGYIIIGILWIVFSVKYRKDMVALQHTLTFVILISITESILWGTDFLMWNQSGNINDILNMVGAIVTAIKLTAVRVLVWIVAVGYTITRSQLSIGHKLGICVLTIIYFVVEAINQYGSIAVTSGQLIPDTYVYLALIVLLVSNSLFFGWIGFEMYQTVKTLKSAEGEKFVMYKRLSILLIVAISLAIMVMITELIIDGLDTADENFRAWWLFDSYWEFAYFACIAFVCWLWRPTEKNTRYAYSELDETMDKAQENHVELEVPKTDTQPKNDVVAEELSSDSSSSDDEED